MIHYISNYIGRQLLQYFFFLCYRDPFKQEPTFGYYKLFNYEDVKGDWENDEAMLLLLKLSIEYLQTHERVEEAKAIIAGLSEENIILK